MSKKKKETSHIPHPDNEFSHLMTENFRHREAIEAENKEALELIEEYSEKEYEIIANNMEIYGGGFFKKIGSAIYSADDTNKRKLAQAFPLEFKKYLSFLK